MPAQRKLARALFDAEVYGAGVNDRVLAQPMSAAGVIDLVDVAELLRALLNLSEPLADEVMVDLMRHLDHHARS